MCLISLLWESLLLYHYNHYRYSQYKIIFKIANIDHLTNKFYKGLASSLKLRKEYSQTSFRTLVVWAVLHARLCQKILLWKSIQKILSLYWTKITSRHKAILKFKMNKLKINKLKVNRKGRIIKRYGNNLKKGI